MNTSSREPVISVKVRFTMTGFDQKAGVRLYAFQGLADGVRTSFTVEVDLTLIARHGIQIQDLPLLCRELLERLEDGQEARALTLSDADMRAYADNCAMVKEAAKGKRKPTRKPGTEGAGAGW